MAHADNRDPRACTFLKGQRKAHLETRKHKQALLRQRHSLGRRQDVAVPGPAGDTERFSTPYPDSPPTQPPSHGLFHNARLIGNTWLDEQGDEFRLPPAMVEDQNWSSQRAQGFWHDLDAGRSHKAPMDNPWGPLLDDDSDTSSESDRSDDEECEMPGLSISEAESNDFAPYASKTVSVSHT